MTALITTDAGPIAEAAAGLRTSTRRRRVRTTVVLLTLLVLLVVMTMASFMLGEFGASLSEIRTVFFTHEDLPARYDIVEVGLPRAVLGVLVGIAFGVAGALFQAVLRNPLASPDVIGISQGASAAAVATLLVGGVTGARVSLAALGGGLAVGLLLYAVAWRGGMTGHRFVLAGIGVSYLCVSLIGYLLTRSEVDMAQAALIWMTGSVSQADNELNRTLATALLILLPLVAVVAPGLSVLLLGDDQAASLGRRPELVRVCVIGLGVALAAVATAAAGPVAFVAFVSAPIARRLLNDGGLALVASALVGALLVVSADVVAQFVLPVRMSVPVGVVTGAVGGPYLIWLMATGRTRTS